MSGTDRLPFAWSVDQLGTAELVAVWKVPADRAKAEHAALLARHRDPAWIEALLARLPAPSLAVIGLLADGAGMLREAELFARASYLGLDREATRAAVFALVREIVVVPLTTAYHEATLALIQPAATVLAAAVQDLDVPLVPAGELPPGPADDGRVLLAVACALRQVDVKLTNDDRPNRTALKKLGKSIGLTEDALSDVIMAAYHADLLRFEGDLILRPELPALRRAATHQYAGLLDTLHAQMRRGQPVPIVSIARWLDRAERTGYRARMHLLLPDRLGWLPGFRRGGTGDVPTVAVVAPSGGAAAASVTPSFEVILPPESRATDLVDVLACCEVTRVDRAITGRITKASIGRAAAAGISAAQILAALATASRTPVPQNVAMAIEDWAGGTAAIVAIGRVVVVPAADGERVRAAITHFAIRPLAEGVFLVDDRASHRELTAALAKIGVTCVLAESMPMTLPGAAPREVPRDLPEFHAEHPSATHRARLEAWLGGDPAERAMLPKMPPLPVTMADSIEDLIEAWEHRTGEVLDGVMLNLMITALERLPPADRGKLLAARDVRGLLGVLEEVTGRRASRGELAWHRTDLATRIEDAIARGEPLVLDLGHEITTVEPKRLLRRGKAWIVLADDEAGEALAIPLSQIQATRAR